MKKFSHATTIDVSMGYCHVPLSKQAQKYCTINFPWGNYACKRLPIGIGVTVELFQQVMASLFGHLYYVHVYLCDMLIISNGTHEDHLNKIESVLNILQKAGFRSKKEKFMFSATKINYLGYRL